MNVNNKLKWLTAYAVFSSFALTFLLFTSFDQRDISEVFDEITVKRINVVSESGDMRLVISNETRQHPGRLNGKDMEPRDRPAGILFFNEEGDECGGLIHYGKTENGSSYSGMSFTMDQYKEDQVIQILNSEKYIDGEEKISRGLLISDLPTGSDLFTRMERIEEIKAQLKDMSEEDQERLIAEIGNSLGSSKRLFLGRTQSNSSGMFLYDPEGNQKLRIYVNESGEARLEVVDDNGNMKNLLD